MSSKASAALAEYDPKIGATLLQAEQKDLILKLMAIDLSLQPLIGRGTGR